LEVRALEQQRAKIREEERQREREENMHWFKMQSRQQSSHESPRVQRPWAVAELSLPESAVVIFSMPVNI
jgi:hypothetical protein